MSGGGADGTGPGGGGGGAPGPKLDRRAVYVKGLPAGAAASAVEAHFSAVGPVRQAFLLAPRLPGEAVVKFSVRGDAERAVAELHGRPFEGQRLSIAPAKRKKSWDERKAAAAAAEPGPAGAAGAAAPPERLPRPRPPLPAGVADGAAGSSVGQWRARTVAVCPVVGGHVEKAVLRKVGDLEGLERCHWPAPEGELERNFLGRDGCAGAAETMLLTFKAVTVARRAVAKLHRKKIKTAEGPHELWARQLGGEGAHVKSWRLIVRNLPFTLTEAGLENVMQPAGFVWDVTVPQDAEGRAKGFGFVAYTCRADAEKAVATLNGVVCKKRTLVVDWAVSKAQYVGNGDGAAPPPPAEGGAPGPTGAGESGGGSGSASLEAGSDSEEMEEGSYDEADATRNALANVLSRARGTPDPEPAAARGGPARGREGKPERRPTGRPAEQREWRDPEACTVFVRNLALDATQSELKAAMEKFGKVTSCRIVVDKATGASAGKAFVEFVAPADAAQACKLSAEVQLGRTKGLNLNGRVLKLHPMLDGKNIKQLAVDKARKERHQKDKRNLYLSKEGHIEPDSGAGRDLSKGDRELRERSYFERMEKLKNPNNMLNPFRLLLRNLPDDMDSKGLKALCIRAVKARATQQSPQVVHAKVLFDAEKGRSRCRGFVEFASSDHSLTALRHLNNNPEIFGKARRPVVEFAVDNIVKKRKHDSNLAKSKRPLKPEKKKATKLPKPAKPAKAAPAAAEEGRKPPRAAEGKKGRKSGAGPAEKRKRKPAAEGAAAAPSKPKKPRQDAAEQRGQRAAAAAKPAKKREKGQGRKGSKGGQTDRFDDLVKDYRKSFQASQGDLNSWF